MRYVSEDDKRPLKVRAGRVKLHLMIARHNFFSGHSPARQTLLLAAAVRSESLANCSLTGASRKLLANVKDEPRPWLARAVLLGARIVTAMVVGSGALFGFSSFTC